MSQDARFNDVNGLLLNLGSYDQEVLKEMSNIAKIPYSQSLNLIGALKQHRVVLLNNRFLW